MLQSVGDDDDGVLALCSVCCVFQSVGGDDDGVLLYAVYVVCSRVLVVMMMGCCFMQCMLCAPECWW